jgi:hypothetical protein
MAVNYIYALKATYEPLRVIAFGAIPAAYSPNGKFGTPLTQIGRILTFKNGTNSDMYISFDGVNDHEWLPSETFDKTDHTSNKASRPGGFLGIPANTQIWIRYGTGAPTAGQATLSVVYGS